MRMKFIDSTSGVCYKVIKLQFPSYRYMAKLGPPQAPFWNHVLYTCGHLVFVISAHISSWAFNSHVHMAWKLDFSRQKVPPHKLGVFLYIIHLNRYHIQGYISGKLTKFIDWIFNYSEFSKMAAGSDLTQLHSGMTSFSNLKLQISSTFQLTH